MVRISGKFTGKHGTQLVHGPSNATIRTSPPVDNGGTGDQFSPTDLLAASYGACMMTIMSLQADARKLDLSGSTFTVEKIMTPTAPRKVAQLNIQFNLPDLLTADQREFLEDKAKSCPVALSVAPDIELNIAFAYGPR